LQADTQTVAAVHVSDKKNKNKIKKVGKIKKNIGKKR